MYVCLNPILPEKKSLEIVNFIYMICKCIVTYGDEPIDTFYFPEVFLKIRVKYLIQISNDTNEFPAAAHITKMVYYMFLS